MTDYMTANTINDLFRSLFALLDKAAYMILGWMYEILFNVASADLFANDTIQKFYGRVQMIIGVFMVFKLAVSIIQGIINPDTFTDKKSGFSNIIGRIVFALIMLTVLTPINIPGAKSSYEINLNNNGLLFGTLYELQDRILANNTLGRLILGTNDGYSYSSNNKSYKAKKQSEEIKKASNVFTGTILKGFVTINLNEGTDGTKVSDRVCGDKIEKEVLDAYNKEDASPNQILSLVNTSCDSQGSSGFFGILAKFVKRLFNGDRYVFAYLPIISTIVAAIFVYILLGEIITIAIRSVKLAVLRLLAPIPIISYIDPKSEKDGAFGAWVKSLTSTYLELFIHLAVIYFILFLINDMIVNGLVINTGTGVIGVISKIFIWIGLFFFVKQAPKFIKDILGVKSSSANVGLAGLLGGTAMLAGGGGLKGFALGAMTGTDAATQGYNQGKAVPLGSVWNNSSDTMAKIRTGDKDAHGGLAGRLQDRLDWGTRERMASKLGYGREDMAEAKYTKGVAEAKSFAAQERLAIAQQRLNSLSSSATEADRTRAMNDYLEALRENNKAQADLSSAEKDYKKIDSTRSQNLRVGPRPIDSSKETYRSTRKVDTKSYSETTHYAGDAPDGGYSVKTSYKRAVRGDGSWAGSDKEHSYTPDLDSYESMDDSRWGGVGPGGPPPGP